MAEEPKKRTGRKLLVAAVGVATVSYIAACSTSNMESSGNLMAPDTGSDTGIDTFASSGNLVPPDTGNPVDSNAVDSNTVDASKSEAATDSASDVKPDGASDGSSD